MSNFNIAHLLDYYVSVNENMLRTVSAILAFPCCKHS